MVGSDQNGNITSFTTTAALQEMFARYGLLKRIVSDNGPQFLSKKIQILL